MRASKTPERSQKKKDENIMKFFGFLGVFFLIAVFCTILTSVQTSLALDEYFSVIYKTTIQPHGEQEIEQIVARVRNISDTSEKLDAIAAWETENFTEIYWEKSRENNLSIKIMDPPIGRWVYESTGKIRPMNNPYANDPAWIAYYRFGACGELAHLFADVANRSGYETRVVVAILKNPPGNHAWAEIKIGDEWEYYDPTVYGEYHYLGKQAFHGRWFNKIENYDIFQPERVAGVYFVDDGVDTGSRYPRLIVSSPNRKIDEQIETIIDYWHIDEIFKIEPQ
ncbi:transglutaminase domain-containing protein [Methanofollis ethanolicus]|uniref:transglutaminase domain-containing protein n=1 Tax=Methanofollis ethanolicus TaxID=488124 RepID=UPI0009FACA4A|nr:transglutaminase domain-containing protein [Methanofollis ethanolicus]